jgi:hypothetical protein
LENNEVTFEEQNQSKYAHRKSILLNLFGNKCACCGYEGSHSSMHFHHIDPSEKTDTISKLLNGKWINVMKEAEKCILLCSRCHAEHHDGVVEIPEDAKTIDTRKPINPELESDFKEVADSAGIEYNKAMKMLFGFDLD